MTIVGIAKRTEVHATDSEQERMKEPRRTGFRSSYPSLTKKAARQRFNVTLTQVMRALESPMRSSSSTTGAQTAAPQFLGISRKQIRAFVWSHCGETLVKLRR